MSLVSISKASVSFGTEEILKDISFAVEPNQKLGLIGVNGAGKTTLFKLITGELEPDSGSVHKNSKLSVGYLSQINQFESDRTLMEEALEVYSDLSSTEKMLREYEIKISAHADNPALLEEIMTEYGALQEEFEKNGGYTYMSKIKGVLRGLGFSDDKFDTPISVLSGGEKSRILLGLMLLRQPELLLLDEPTNHLDIEAISWLEKYLREYNGTLIVISHDRYFLDKIVNGIILIENKKAFTYSGSYSEYSKKRKLELEQRKRQYLNQQKEIAVQKEIIERFTNYGSARYIKQGQSRQKLLDKMVLIEDVSENAKTTMRFNCKRTSGRDVLRAENISKTFGDKKVIDDANFSIYKSERIGLIGGNGAGKTTLFKMITRQLSPDSGNIFIGSNVDFGYFNQEMENLSFENTVIEELWDEYPKLNHFDIRSRLAQFNFIGNDIFKIVGDLSGGEKGRLELLKLMMSGTNTLLLDEPTNHLDIDSKESLEEALSTYEGTIIVISHDRYFLNNVCTKLLELENGHITEYLGNYDYYIEKKNAPTYDDEEDVPTKTQIEKNKKLERKQREELKNQKRELDNLMKRIEKLENKIKSIDAQTHEAVENGAFDSLKQLAADREAYSVELEELSLQWLELSDE